MGTGAPLPVQAQYVEPTLFESTGVFESPLLKESSGIAVSRRLPGVLWTHNDSSDGPHLYATNLAGADLGFFRIAGAEAVDWEDIALGPCPLDSDTGACLYIADTGDNRERRDRVAIYILEEPDVVPGPGRSEDYPGSVKRLLVSYADGPQDVEAMAVDTAGNLLLASKGRSGPIKLYRVGANSVRATAAEAQIVPGFELVPSRSLGRLATGAAVSPGGSQLAVRTYTEIIFFTWDGLRATPLGLPCFLGVREPQGEAIDFLDEDTLVLTSESRRGFRGGLSRVQCPHGAAEGGP
jgi:hypothetical protein